MSRSSGESKIILTVTRGPDEGASYEFTKGPVRIGRHPGNSIVIRDPYVSAMHGKIYRAEETFLFEDLQSMNGSSILRGSEQIYLDQSLRYRAPLQSGDRLLLGFKRVPVVLDFSLDAPVAPVFEVDSDITQIVDSIPPDSFDQSALKEAFYGQALAILNRVSGELNTVFEFRKAVEALGLAVIEMFSSSTHAAILIRHDGLRKLLPVFSRRRDGRKFVDERFAVHQTVIRHVLDKGEAVLFTNDNRAVPETRSTAASRRNCGICAPLIQSGKVRGMLVVEDRDNPRAFAKRDVEILTLMAHQANMVIDRIRLYRELQDTFEQTIRGLAVALEAKDQYTHGHSEQVASYCRLIADAMALPPEEADLIVRASLMHDIGKIGVQYSILNKEGKLTESELAEIRNHPVVGKRIIEPIRFLRDIVPIVYHHHERYDGNGYPEGKKGEEIPLGARILAVADTYHAMTSDRAYRRRRHRDAAIEELRRNAGTQFDPKVVDVFVREIGKLSEEVGAEDADAAEAAPALQ